MEDIRAAVLALRKRGQETIGLVGHSKGGNGVLLYTSKYDDVPRVVNIAGRFHMDKGITERFGKDIFTRLKMKGAIPVDGKKEDGTSFRYQLTKQSMDARLKLDMAAVCRAIGKAEVLTLHGGQDQVVPVEDAHAMAACISDHTLRIIEGANHGFTQHREELMQAVIAFLAL